MFFNTKKLELPKRSIPSMGDKHSCPENELMLIDRLVMNGRLSLSDRNTIPYFGRVLTLFRAEASTIVYRAPSAGLRGQNTIPCPAVRPSIAQIREYSLTFLPLPLTEMVVLLRWILLIKERFGGFKYTSASCK